MDWKHKFVKIVLQSLLFLAPRMASNNPGFQTNTRVNILPLGAHTLQQSLLFKWPEKKGAHRVTQLRINCRVSSKKKMANPYLTRILLPKSKLNAMPTVQTARRKRKRLERRRGRDLWCPTVPKIHYNGERAG